MELVDGESLADRIARGPLAVEEALRIAIQMPVWSPDGSRIVFQSDRESDLAVFSHAADGSGTAIRVTKPDAGVAHEPTSWSPDGASLLVEGVKSAERSLSRVSVGDRRIEPPTGIHSTNPINATFSPDGRWVAYGSNEPGTDAIFVEPFPQTGAKYQISRSDIGHHPVWSRDGGRLFYIPGPGRFASVGSSPLRAFRSAPCRQRRGASCSATRSRTTATTTSDPTDARSASSPKARRRSRGRCNSTSSSTGQKS